MVIIAVLCVLCYLPALRGGFVFDDSILIVEHPLIHAADGLHRIWFTTEAPDYYPITWTALWLQWHCWGANSLGFHVVNLVLHIANAMLLVQVLRRLAIPGAWFAGLGFAVHPVNVASVAWIIEQKNTLAMLFFLLTVLSWLRYEENGKPLWYGSMAGCFLLSLLSKPAAIMWPVVFLGLVYFRKGRVTVRDLAKSVPLFLVSAAIAVATVWFQAVRVLNGQPAMPDEFLIRLAVAGRAVWFYSLKILVPLNLSMIYPKWTIDSSSLFSYLPGVAVLLLLLLFWRTRRSWGRAFLAGFGFFVVMLFPVLGFFDQGFYRYSYVADHWQYLPMIGILALLAYEFVTLLDFAPRPAQAIVQYAGITLVSILGVLSWQQSHIYQNEKALWLDTIQKNPRASLAYYNLGVTLGAEGNLSAAQAAYEAALRIKPDYTDAIYNLGTVLAEQGHTDEGIQCWLAAVHEQPDYDEAHNNLGAMYAQRGEFRKAILHLSLVLLLKPHDAAARANLGTVYQQQGNWKRAITEFQLALKEDPNLTPVRLNLSLALAQSGNISGAIETLQDALVVDPENRDARSLLDQLITKSRSSDLVK